MFAGGIVTMPIAGNDPEARQRVGQLVAELGMDPVDFGPLTMAGYIDALQFLYMIPILQRRDEHWEFYFRRTADWTCKWRDDWSTPVADADRLPEMPNTQEPLVPCPD